MAAQRLGTHAAHNERGGYLEAMDPEAFEAWVHGQRSESVNVETSPNKSRLLGRYTVFCLICNRTIGSGIWTVPPKILAGTGSIGGALLIWSVAGLIATCGAICWVELGLTIPFHPVKENGRWILAAAPRNGGEKNFLEYIWPSPKFLMTCMFGIMFIILGNISGNSVAFGIYIMIAAGRDPIGKDALGTRLSVYGIAVALLTFCAAFHIFTRRGGIMLNNIMATFKIALILALALLGFVHAGGRYLQRLPGAVNEPAVFGAEFNITSMAINDAVGHNLSPLSSFVSEGNDGSSIFESFLYALFAYTGFRQPFYVLTEVEEPRKYFPTWIPSSMLVITSLYVITNLAYFAVVPKEAYLSGPINTITMASLFLHYLFDNTAGPDTARRVMAGLISVSIFGNIIAMTFAAARVKQELAKEGILPFSLFFARGYVTPWSRIRRRPVASASDEDSIAEFSIETDSRIERSPAAALFLHWLSSVVLVAVTAFLKPTTSYSLLLGLFSYCDHILIGALVSGGLLYLKFDAWRTESRRRWSAIENRYTPYLSPLHVVVYFIATTFLLFAAFVPPVDGSPFTSEVAGYAWYILPIIGCSSPLWGAAWWLGLRFVRWRARIEFRVERFPCNVRDPSGKGWIQVAEFIKHRRVFVVNGEKRDADVESQTSMELTSLTDSGRDKQVSSVKSRPIHGEEPFFSG